MALCLYNALIQFL